EGEYLGPIDLRRAIAVSDNSVFAQLTDVVGPDKVVEAARALGITSPLQNYFSIGLGGEPATPLEMARAFASFAYDGYRIDGSLFGNTPRAALCVQGSKDKRSSLNHPERRPALSRDPPPAQDRAAVVDAPLHAAAPGGPAHA